MSNQNHINLLKRVRQHAGAPTQHTNLDRYLGTTAFRYPISTPLLRRVVKDWMKKTNLPTSEVAKLITSLIHGKSSTEKTIAGVLLDYTTPPQRKFKPAFFEEWVEHLTGWAEVDAMCSGKYTATELFRKPAHWGKLLLRMAKSKNIHKRRASMVMLVQPLRAQHHPFLADTAFVIIDHLKSEKEILITKAISWLLRSMIKNHRERVVMFLEQNTLTLPAIARRETLTKLKTGRKTKKK